MHPAALPPLRLSRSRRFLLVQAHERVRWSSRAIWALGTPSLSIRLISFCSSRDTVMLPSSFWAGLANGLRPKANIVIIPVNLHHPSRLVHHPFA